MTLLSQFIHVAEAAQFKMLIFSLILLGVPHGALDLYIEKKNISNEFSKSDKVLFKYLLNIIVYALLWYISPIAALVIFILITAYHFGEIDWIGQNRSSHAPSSVFFTWDVLDRVFFIHQYRGRLTDFSIRWCINYFWRTMDAISKPNCSHRTFHYWCALLYTFYKEIFFLL